MTILVTGVAGFIGSHVAHTLIHKGHDVIGVDSLNSYYNPKLKLDRLSKLNEHKDKFRFYHSDVSDIERFKALCLDYKYEITGIIHLAAQAGVRHSLTVPLSYIQNNVVGQLSVLEAAKELPQLKHVVYASSSSVYGGLEKLPFSVEDKTDSPVSPYGATKKCAELLSYSYSSLYQIPMSGLRFFTVYGPWGRPDMAAYIFTKSIFLGKTIRVFNYGDMRRDFTFIDDIVKGILACLNSPPSKEHGVPHAVYNLGNNKSEALMDFIRLIEESAGKKAVVEFLPMQKGDVKETYADIDLSKKTFNFEPSTCIEEGIPRFVEWFKNYHNL
jgi:UDP-glucuronate 4-epimerase